MQNKAPDLLTEIAAYYSNKLVEYGDTPQGVDWNGEESQKLRFRQLAKLFGGASSFTISDLGCGYGAFYEFLGQECHSFSYIGLDVSEGMIQAAEQRYGNQTRARFVLSGEPLEMTDYSVASGIFNVRLGRSDDEWLAYLARTLDAMDRSSKRGFAFNCLTSYSDEEKMRDYLYYANPGSLFDLCKRRYSKNVALLHDYGLYEFTILVRK